MSDITALAAYALRLIAKTADPQATWADTYESTAVAFAEEATEHSLFGSSDGPERTVALYASVSWFESRHNPKAEGDGKCAVWKPGTPDSEKLQGTASAWCARRTEPHSFCLGQVNDSNFKWLGVTKEDLLGDVRICVRNMGKMFAESFRKGRECGLPVLDRLSWYTGGGPIGCDATAKGRHRMLKAEWLFNNVK